MIGINLVEELGFESNTLKRFKETSSTDETSRVVMEYVLKGWPSEKEQVDELAREYWSSLFLRRTMTSRVEICPHWKLETRCGFAQIGIKNGGKLKYYRDHTYWKMNKGVSIEETDGR